MIRLLPQLMANITGYPREKVDNLQWSRESIVYNIVRLWELICWRRKGIRAETSASVYGTNTPACAFCNNIRKVLTLSPIHDSKLTYVYAFHTWEAVFMAIEHAIKQLFTFDLFALSRIRLFVPQLAGGYPLAASPYLFAIAIDNTGQETTSTSASALTIASMVVSGSNNIIFLGATASDTNKPTGATYNAVSAVKQDEADFAGCCSKSIFYLTGNNGTHDAVVNWSGNHAARMVVTSYSGALQASPIEAVAGPTVAAATSVSQAVTTITDNALVVAICGRDGTTGTMGNGTGTNLRIANATGVDTTVGLADATSLKTPAGSVTLQCVTNSSAHSGIYVMSLAPAAGAATVQPSRRMRLGLG